MVFTTEQISEIKSKAIAATEQLRIEFAPVKEQLKKREEDVKAAKAALIREREQNPPSKEVLIGEAILKIDICNDGQVSIAELIKVITGMDISLPISVPVEEVKEIIKQHIPLSMVVPTKNDNGHNYPLNIPVMMICDIRGEDCDSDFGIKTAGGLGNHLHWEKSGLRPATDNEIDMFFKAWEVLSEMGVPLCEGYDVLGIEEEDED